MIALLRIDNRLVHGQILVAWVPFLHVRRVVVADDEAASTPLAMAAMSLCLPPGLKAEVALERDVNYRALASSPEPALVLFREVAALERAVAAGLTPDQAPRVNLDRKSTRLNSSHSLTSRMPSSA